MPMLRPLTICFSALVLATGAIYPAMLTALARILFPKQAEGSLLWVEGRIRGSRLIGQATEDPRYFWGRPSLTTPYATNASASAGSTMAASDPRLKAAVAARVARLKASDPSQGAPIPQDLVTASASGLDPHASWEAIRWQAPRIARRRAKPLDEVLTLAERHARTAGDGSRMVNTLELNAHLDQSFGRP